MPRLVRVMGAFPKPPWSDTEGRGTDASSGSPTGVAERRVARQPETYR
jgi:hypothetical protein